VARDLVTEIRAADQRLKTLTAEIAATVAASGSRLTEVDGPGSGRSWPAGCLAAPGRRAGFPPRRLSPAMPVSHPSR
jgi:hypothetical protein